MADLSKTAHVFVYDLIVLHIELNDDARIFLSECMARKC